MIVSLILIFIYHGEVSFESTVRLHGATLTVGQPDVIFTMLLLSLAYFLWRFYKYFHHDQAHTNLRNQYNSTLSNLQDSEITKQIVKQLPKDAQSFSGDHSFYQIKKLDCESGFYEVPVQIPVKNEHEYEYKTELISIENTPIQRKRYHALVSFTFRGKILSDFYVPFVLALYAGSLSIYDHIRPLVQ